MHFFTNILENKFSEQTYEKNSDRCNRGNSQKH